MSSRRIFFGALAGSLAALPATLQAAPRRTPRSEEWDLRWLDDLKGEHRQIFDVGPVHEGLLHVPMNWLNAHNEVYGLRDDQLNAVVGLASRGFPANASDALWEKFGIGERYEIRDPEIGEWATRNIMVHVPADAPAMVRGMSVPALVDRGVIFWQCDNSLRGIAERAARTMDQDPEEVYQEFKAGLLPHVKLVPAHTMLVGLCQERGCTYEMLF